jgi:hypothetical protein
VKPLPSPRSGHRMVQWKHFIVLFGGFYDAGAETKYLDDLWIFDTKEFKWLKVDWLNDPNAKPSPRSGFQFISLETGIILYGGYNQVKVKGGIYEGHVLSDMWHLKIDAVDVKKTRWEKRKISATAPAPLPRSGPCSAVAKNGKSFFLFGGVQDENLSEELLNGTCLNDLWEYNNEKGQWRHHNQLSKNLPIPRYNASMVMVSSSSALITGGIFEHEDRQFVLDDAHTVNIEKLEKYSCLRELTVDLDNWQGSEDEDEEGDSEDSGDSDSNSDSDSEDSDSCDSSNDSSNDDSDDNQATLFYTRPDSIDPSIPQPFPDQPLKEYFSTHQSFWIDQARQKYNTMTDSKQVRAEAFQLAQQAFNEFDLHRMLLK